MMDHPVTNAFSGNVSGPTDDIHLLFEQPTLGSLHFLSKEHVGACAQDTRLRLKHTPKCRSCRRYVAVPTFLGFVISLADYMWITAPLPCILISRQVSKCEFYKEGDASKVLRARTCIDFDTAAQMEESTHS